MRPEEREAGEVLSPSHLATVQILLFHKPLQIRMVVPDVELMLGSFQVMVPLFCYGTAGPLSISLVT